jgi:hypothetical protein
MDAASWHRRILSSIVKYSSQAITANASHMLRHVLGCTVSDSHHLGKSAWLILRKKRIEPKQQVPMNEAKVPKP